VDRLIILQSENSQCRDDLADPGADENAVSKGLIKKWYVRMWIWYLAMDNVPW
jgi:hypothetical protein